MRVENRQEKCYHEKNSHEPGRELHEDVRGLRAEDIFRHCPAKRGAQALAFRSLHQDHQHHEQRHQHPHGQKQTNQDRHRDGKYERQMTNVE